MDSGNTSKKKVTLVGFGPKFDGKTIPKRENTDPSITIKLNGINLSPTSDETKCAQNEKVKLVGFARQQSVGPGDNAANVNGTAQRKAKFKSEREERYSRLADDSRDFFSRMNGPSRGNASGSSRPRFEDTFGEGSEHMKKFFDEARQKFDQCSNELFDKFVQENRERFAQMLDTNARMRGSDASENSSWSRHEKSESFSSEQTSSTAGSRSASENGFHARTPSTATTDSSGSSTFKTTSSFVPEPPFESAFPKADPFSKFARPEFPLGSRQFMSFPTFPTFMPFTASPTPSPGHSPRLGRGAYQMSSSKSTFEYCGNTNTYK